MKKKRTNAFPLRLEDELRLQVEKSAKQDRRSVNTWILLAIEEKLKNESLEAAS